MATPCNTGSTFRLESGPSSGTGAITINSSPSNADIQICTATQILDRLHREFTEKYEPVPSGSGTVPLGKTKIAAELNVNPTFHLRNQPPIDASDPTNRFYKIFTEKTEANPEYRSVVSAIMKGVNDTSVSYKTAPTPEQTDFNIPTSFKGIYGLINVNTILEKNIAEIVGSFSSMNPVEITNTDRYEMRSRIKTTFEEIAHRENQIYREKFLNIILMIVGLFIVSAQLIQKYFSFEGGGGGGGFGFGGGSLFSGFGIGSGSGLFSRFGGLGLGRSGRSRIGSSLFTNNPYSLSNR